jgi:hypothetical protein
MSAERREALLAALGAYRAEGAADEDAAADVKPADSDGSLTRALGKARDRLV